MNNFNAFNQNPYGPGLVGGQMMPNGGIMPGLAGVNPVSEPALLNTQTGELSWMWVNWFRSKTGASLPEAAEVGVLRMLELHKQISGFVREYTTNKHELLAKFPDYGPSNSADYLNFFLQHLGKGNRYTPRHPDEPSPFAAPPRLKEGEEAPINDWAKWYMGHTGCSQEEAVENCAALIGHLVGQQRITPETLHLTPHPMTKDGNVSLTWVLWVADCQPDANFNYIHHMGMSANGAQRGKGHFSGDGSFSSGRGF